MKRETKKKGLLNTLLISKLHSYDTGELQDAINELKAEFKYDIDDIVEVSGLSRSSVYSYLTGKDKKDKTQIAHKLINKFSRNLDFDVMTDYFRTYVPKNSEDKLKLQILITVLMDCVKR